MSLLPIFGPGLPTVPRLLLEPAETPFVLEQGVLSADYDVASEYTFAGAGSSIELNTDPAFIKQGAGSLKVTANRGSANPTNVRTNAMAAYLNPRGRLGWWVYVVNYTLLTSLTLAAYNTYNSKFWFQSYNFADGDKAYNGWHWVSLAADQITGATGTPSWSEDITVIELRINQNSATQTVVYIDSGYQGFFSKPMIMITADDGYATQYTAMYPELVSRNLKATFGIIGSLIGSHADYMTVNQLQEMHSHGNDLAVHGATSLASLADTAAREADIQANKDFLTNHNWNRAINHYIYPNGVYQLSAGNTEIYDILTAKGFVSGRGTTSPRTMNCTKGLGKNAFNIPIIGGVQADAPATLITRIDQVITRGDLGILMFHKILPSGASNTIEYNIADLRTVLDYLKTKVDAGLLVCPTISQWYRAVT